MLNQDRRDRKRRRDNTTGLVLSGLGALLFAGVFATLGIAIALLILRDDHSACPNEPCKCKKISTVPFTMSEFGRCYRFTKNLEFDTDFAFALTATAGNMRLYKDGYKLTISGALSSGLLVEGTTGVFSAGRRVAAGLTVYDAWIESPFQQYSIINYGAVVEPTASLHMDNARIHRMNVGVWNINGNLHMKHTNMTVNVEEDSELRLRLFGAELLPSGLRQVEGIECIGSTICKIEDYTFHCDKTSIGGASEPGPAFCTGLNHWHTPNAANWSNPDPFELLTLNPGELVASDINIRADAGIIALRATSIKIKDVHVEFPEDFCEFCPNVGVLVGCGNNTNGFIHNVDIIGYAMNPVGGMGFILIGTNGLDVDRVNVIGRNRLGPNPFDFPELDRLSIPWHPALVHIDVFSGTLNTTGATLSRFTVTALDNETYGVAIATDQLTAPVFSKVDDDCNPNTYVTMRDFNVHYGAVGVLVGSHARGQLSLENFVVGNSSYGIYFKEGAENVRIKDSYFSKHCVGAFLESGVSNIISRNNDFSGNAANLVNNAGGGAIETSNPLFHTGTGVDCVRPELYDSCIEGLALSKQFGPRPPTALGFSVNPIVQIVKTLAAHKKS